MLALPVDCLGDFGPCGLSVQYTQDICGCPTHISTLVLGLSMLALPVDCLGDFGPRGLFVQYTQDVRGCPPAHAGRPWLSVAVRQHTQDVRGCPSVHISARCTHRTPVGVRQHTQVVCGCLWLSVSTHRTSVAVHVCPCVSVSTHRTSVGVRQHTLDVRCCRSVHISARWYLDSATVTLLVDCLDDFGPRGLSVQYTQDVRGCPPAHTGRPCLSVSTHRTSVAVRLCLCVSVSTHIGHSWLSINTHISFLVLGLSMLALPMDCLGEFSPRGLFVQYTQDVCECPPEDTRRLWLSVSTHRTSVAGRSCLCVSVSTHTGRLWLSVHIGRPWVSVSTHRTSVAVRGCPPTHTRRPTLALPMDSLDDFGPCGLSVQYTQDVRGYLSAHPGRPCVSVSTHRTSVCVRQHNRTSGAVHVCSCMSVSTHMTSVAVHHTHRTFVGVHQHTQVIRGCPPAHTGRPWLSVAVRQHTQDVSGCPSAHTRRLWLCVCVRVCPSAHTGRPWLSISTHISTLVLGLSMLARPVDCLDDFGPRGLSVQYTLDVRGCPPAHTGRTCLSVSTHMTYVAVCSCLCVSVSTHTGRLWLSISTHICMLVLGLNTLALPVDCLGDFGPRGLSVQYTQDVRECPPAHTRCLWLSLSTYRTTHISTLVLGLSTLALPVDCSGDLRPVALENERKDLSCVKRWAQSNGGKDVRGCPCVSVSKHMTSVAVHQYKYQHYTQDVRGCPPAHTGRLWLSVAVRQHTQDVCGCPCVSVSTHKTFVAVHQYTYQHVGPLAQHAGPSRGLFGYFGPCGLSVQYTQDVRGCLSAHTGRPCVSVSTHRTSVCVHQHKQDVRGCPFVSVSTHRTSVAVHQYTYQHYRKDVRGCPPAHTGRLWLSVAVRQHTQDVCGCPCVSVCVRQHTQDVRGCPSVHISARWSLDSARWPFPWTVWAILAMWAVCSVHTGRLWHTHNVCGCPSAQTGRPCVSFSTHRTSVAVRVCPSAHTGRPWLSISTDIRTLVLGLSTLALPVDCLGDFGPRGLFVQYTQDVHGCPPAHTDRPWLSVAVRQHTQDVCGCPCVSVCVRQHTQDVCGCPSAQTGRPCVSISTHRTSLCVRVCPSALAGRPWLSISTHISTLVLGLSTLALPVDCLGDFGLRGLSVQYTQDIRGCSPAHTGRLWLSVSTHRTYVAVRSCLCVCPSAHTQDVCGCPLLHISARWSLDSPCWPFPWTVWVILAHVGYLLSTHRMSVGVRQHTQVVRGCLWLSVSTHRTYVAVRVCPSAHTDVRGCPSAQTGRTCVSFSTHRTSVAVCVCPCVSVCVHVCPSEYTGRSWLSISTHISMLVLGLSTLALPVECSGDFGPRGLSVQYTKDVRGCPPAHTERLWLSVSTHRTTNRTSVCVLQHTQDVSGCSCVSVSTHRTFVAVHQYRYQNVGPWTQHAGPSRGLFG
ncbi:hypothetical protein YC2023_066272 [Brassica napus]